MGPKMTLAGIKNEIEIDKLWAYFKEFGPDGKKK
jgi:cytochrome c2